MRSSHLLRHPQSVRILVVDDDPKLAGLIRRSLVEKGNAADVAARGEDALWMARAHSYDAIVLDLMLPGLGGGGTWGALREGDGIGRALGGGRVEVLGVGGSLKKKNEPPSTEYVSSGIRIMAILRE